MSKYIKQIYDLSGHITQMEKCLFTENKSLLRITKKKIILTKKVCGGSRTCAHIAELKKNKKGLWGGVEPALTLPS